MIERYHAVVKRSQAGYIMSILAVFPTVVEAYAYAENANQWYGEKHPMTPLTVAKDVLFSPSLFPVLQ
jgi:hypothetical protein